MLNKYVERESGNGVKPNDALASVQQEDPSLNENVGIKVPINEYGNKLKNSDVINKLDQKLSQQKLIKKYLIKFFLGFFRMSQIK